MGLIRKVSSVSTLGAVKFTSKREAQTKAAQEQAKLARAERKSLESEAKATRRQADADKPWYRQPTVSAAIQRARADNSAADDSSPAERLRKLAELHDQGILTDEEFAAKKAELLDRL